MNETPLAVQPPNPNITIRPVRLSDLEPLRVMLWPERSPDTIYRLVMRVREAARQGRGLGVVAAGAPGQVMGYGQFMLWPRCGEISDLIVTPTLRGQGIGTALIQYLVRAAREMHAECVDIGAAMSNPGAIALYRRLGFRDSYTQHFDLGNGEEDILYLRIKFRG